MSNKTSSTTAQSDREIVITVESMGTIMSRTSQLDPDVPISVHPAPDILRAYPFYPCGYNRD
nr:hypothetical protein [Iphinoe sp. HA4291-MV1]